MIFRAASEEAELGVLLDQLNSLNFPMPVISKEVLIHIYL